MRAHKLMAIFMHHHVRGRDFALRPGTIEEKSKGSKKKKKKKKKTHLLFSQDCEEEEEEKVFFFIFQASVFSHDSE